MWCQTGLFTENTIKVIVIQESDLLADLCIGQIRIAKKLHCLLDAQVRDLLVDAAAIELPGKIVQPGTA